MLPGPSYFEIQAADPDKVMAFYTAVFGWTFEKTPNPAPAAYWHIYGGGVAMPEFAIPGRLWQGDFLDPEGNVFGINQLDSDAGI